MRQTKYVSSAFHGPAAPPEVTVNRYFVLAMVFMILVFASPARAQPQSNPPQTAQPTAQKTIPRDALKVLQEADAAIAARDYKHAENILQTAIDAYRGANQASAREAESLAKLWHRLAVVSRIQGEHYTAIDQLNRAVDSARAAPDAKLPPLLLADLGASYLLAGEYAAAVNSLTESLKLFPKPYTDAAPIKAGINLVHALIEQRQKPGIETRLAELNESINVLADAQERRALLLSLGRLYQLAQQQLAFPDSWRKKSFDIFANARTLSPPPGLETYLDGFTGELYEDEGRYEEAMVFTRRALFRAQNLNAKDVVFRWEWQLARLSRGKGDQRGALTVYRQSVDSLQKVRPRLLAGDSRNFKKYIEPIYNQYFDLLLSEARAQKDSRQLDAMLKEAIDAIENYRVAEVEDYFQNACVEQDVQKQFINRADLSTAVVYPLILPDRVELIVNIGGHLGLYAVAIGKEEVTRTIRQFREKLQNPRLQADHLKEAQSLYHWLVRPYEERLAKAAIRNLVFVPDGPMRTIPLAALHDGKQYLIEKIAVAVTPSLSLTKLDKEQRLAPRILAKGLTKAVQGYDALPSVDVEMQNIRRVYPAATYMDEAFVLAKTETELTDGDYSIVHMATHGEFSSDYRYSYLLTYDDKLTMPRLETTIGLRQFTGKPLDLLVLSACQTAVGDDRAALGLAGVAIQAGARSAVATLWFINDEATSKLMSELYRQLADPKNNKARALQKAQLSLLKSGNRTHPYYWSPFVLIGNWM
ncbi:MAG TPA: CHAT domain-containing protein [Gammaproteobacteria bacterium]